VLTQEENELLTRVGPGTLMGNLLRRYWTPACLSMELEADGSRTVLIEAAKAVAEGKEPPGLATQGDFRSIRAAEKILDDGEDWRVLGTDDDPAVQEALAPHRGELTSSLD
jgi:hypothetical protein